MLCRCFSSILHTNLQDIFWELTVVAVIIMSISWSPSAAPARTMSTSFSPSFAPFKSPKSTFAPTHDASSHSTIWWNKFWMLDWSDIGGLGGSFADFADVEDILNITLSFVCVICAGLAAGLTMGLLSLDQTKLEIKCMTGTNEEKHDARMILPVVKQHHMLLCTLLLFNSVSNEALPVFLDTLVPDYMAILMSVTLVLIFGEILPSAFFTGPTQLHTAATFIPFVKILMFLFYPLAFPLSCALDYFFGVDEEENLSREELGALVTLQSTATHRKPKKRESIENFSQASTSKKSADDEDSDEDDGLNMIEVSIITGMLKLSTILVSDTMTTLKDVFMLSDSVRLDESTLDRIWHCGYSRVPIFHRKDKQHIVGYLLVKALILVNAAEQLPIETLSIREPLFITPGSSLVEMLALFRGERTHLAMVTNDPASALRCIRAGKRPSEGAAIMGIITMEDVIEKMLQGEINDETDQLFTSKISGKAQLKQAQKTAMKRASVNMGILSMGRQSIIHSINRASITQPHTPGAGRKREVTDAKYISKHVADIMHHASRYGSIPTTDVDDNNVEMSGANSSSPHHCATDHPDEACTEGWSRIIKESINIEDIGGYDELK